MENLNDSKLIDLYIKESNHKAFDKLIQKYGQVIYRFTFKLLNNKDEAHDATQEVFISVWKNINKFDNKKSFKSWLFTIAKNKAMDILRKRKTVNFSILNDFDDENEFEDNIPDNEPQPSEIFERNENIKLIQDALENISFEKRTIILLHNGEEMTFEEISEIIEKPMNTVKSQYRRALIELKKYLTNKNAPK